METYFKNCNKRYNPYPGDYFNVFSLVQKNDPDRQRFT